MNTGSCLATAGNSAWIFHMASSRSPAGWPTLTIQNGRVSLGSVNEAAFGVKFLLNTGQFTSADEWEWE